jgi:AcrR family transcriptional regulator
VPRAGLTPEIVVAEAAAVADEVGLDRMTLAAIAERVGVAVPSLYKHVDGLDALQRHLAVQAVDELGAALAKATAGRSGADALRSMAKAYRHYATVHPGRYAATVRAPEPDDSEHLAAAQAVFDIVAAVLEGYGLRGDDAIDAARSLRSALHGFAALESAGGFGLPRRIDRSFERMIDGLDAALSSWPAGRSRPRRGS